MTLAAYGLSGLLDARGLRRPVSVSLIYDSHRRNYFPPPGE